MCKTSFFKFFEIYNLSFLHDEIVIFANSMKNNFSGDLADVNHFCSTDEVEKIPCPGKFINDLVSVVM